MNLSIGKTLICPSGTPELGDRKFDIEQLYHLESRTREVGFVNKVTAPELMQAFIDGYGIAARACVELEWELTQAKKHLEERKAVVILDIAPKYLQEKGLVRPSNPAGSEDQRKAVLARDEQYKSLYDRQAMIEAAVAFLETKKKTFESSYQAVKKVYDSLSSVNALASNRGSGEFSAPSSIIGKPHY
jgi:hypothetical protein